MPAQSEIKVVFSLDLSAYVQGLKSMLAATQDAGNHLAPLLHLQVKAPDTRAFDEQLQQRIKHFAENSSAAMKTSQEQALQQAELQKQLADLDVQRTQIHIRETDSRKQLVDDEIEKYEEERSFMTGPFQAGFQEVFNQFVISHRQAKNEADAIWLAIRNSMFQTLGAMLFEEIKNSLARIALKAKTEASITGAQAVGTASRVAIQRTEQASNLTTAASAGASGTAKAGESAAGLPFPLNLIAIAAAIAAATVLFLGISRAFGFERGGRLRKGERGFIEGYEPEIIAPEKTFVQVMREELMPAIIGGMFARDVLLPQIRRDVLHAPALMYSVGAIHVEDPAKSGESPLQIGASGGELRTTLNINISHSIITRDFVRNELKREIEALMRELGASKIDDVFVNQSKRVVQ